MWEPRRLTALWASTASYRDSFTLLHIRVYIGCPAEVFECKLWASWFHVLIYMFANMCNELSFHRPLLKYGHGPCIRSDVREFQWAKSTAKKCCCFAYCSSLKKEVRRWLVTLYQTARCHVPGYSSLHTHRRENISSRVNIMLPMLKAS
jgi:hypothetical protein